jgi:hypothetical protein
MAKDVTHNPWKFDAAAQGEGKANSGVFAELDRIYVKNITAVGDGTNEGTIIVKDKSGGRIIAQFEIATDDHLQVQPIFDFVGGIYIDTLDATNAIVLVYHGRV